MASLLGTSPSPLNGPHSAVRVGPLVALDTEQAGGDFAHGAVADGPGVGAGAHFAHWAVPHAKTFLISPETQPARQSLRLTDASAAGIPRAGPSRSSVSWVTPGSSLPLSGGVTRPAALPPRRRRRGSYRPSPRSSAAPRGRATPPGGIPCPGLLSGQQAAGVVARALGCTGAAGGGPGVLLGHPYPCGPLDPPEVALGEEGQQQEAIFACRSQRERALSMPWKTPLTATRSPSVATVVTACRPLSMTRSPA